MTTFSRLSLRARVRADLAAQARERSAVLAAQAKKKSAALAMETKAGLSHSRGQRGWGGEDGWERGRECGILYGR